MKRFCNAVFSDSELSDVENGGLKFQMVVKSGGIFSPEGQSGGQKDRISHPKFPIPAIFSLRSGGKQKG